jgi:hypothetical protein
MMPLGYQQIKRNSAIEIAASNKKSFKKDYNKNLNFGSIRVRFNGHKV